MKWLGPTLRVIGWTALIGFGATNFATIGTVELAKRLGGIPLEVLIDFLSGSIAKWLKKEPGMGGLEFRAFHECVFESAHRATESGAVPRVLELPNQIKSQAKQAGEAWNAILIELHGVSELGSLLGGRNDPHQSDIEEILVKLYPMLKGAVLSMIAAEVFISFERKFIEMLSREDSQQLYRQRLLSAVLEMHRDMMFKLDAIHIDVKESRGEIHEIREILVAKIAIDTNAPESKQEALRLYNEAVDVIQSRAEGDAVNLLSRSLQLDPSFFDAFVARAVAYVNRKDYLSALSDLDRALTIRSGDATALWIRSTVREFRKDASGAIEDARQAIARDPENATYHVRLGYSLAVGDRNEEARAVFEKAIALDPNSANARQGLATVIDDFDKRLTLLQEAVALQPSWGKAHLDLGLTLLHFGREAEAKHEFERATELDSSLGQGWVQLGYLAAPASGRVEAEKFFLRAIEADPELALGYASLGASRFEYGEYKEALESLTQAIERTAMPEVYSLRGLTYEKLGEFNKAFDDYSIALQLRPTYTSAYFNRGNLYKDAGLFADAINDFTKAIELDPSHYEAHTERSRCRIQTGDLQGAMADCDRAIAIDPNNHDGYFRRARVYQTMEDYSRSEEDYRHILTMFDDANVFNNLGTVLTAQGKYQEAIDAFDKAIAQGIGSRGLVNRSVPYVAMGRASEAANDIRQAISEVPDWRREIQENPEFKLLLENPETRAAIG